MDKKWFLHRLPFTIGFSAGPVIIGALNWYSFERIYQPHRICFDCGRIAGVPFTMYNSGYFWGGEGFVASGVFANLCVSLILGAVSGLLFSLIWRALTRTYRANIFK